MPDRNKILNISIAVIFLMSSLLSILPVTAQTLTPADGTSQASKTVAPAEATPAIEETALPNRLGETVLPPAPVLETPTPVVSEEGTPVVTEVVVTTPTATQFETPALTETGPTPIVEPETPTLESTPLAVSATPEPTAIVTVTPEAKLTEEVSAAKSAKIQAIIMGEPVAPTVPVQECKINASGQTIVTADFSSMAASANGATAINVKSIERTAKTVTLFASASQSVASAYMSFKIIGGTFGAFTANTVGAKMSTDKKTITLFVENMSAEVSLTVIVNPDADATFFTVNSEFYSGVPGCYTNLTLHEPFSDCTVNWHAAAYTDVSLIDFSNNGYTDKVNCAKGYLAVHHWTSVSNKDPNSTADKLAFRVPFATLYALTNGSLKLTPSSNFTLVPSSLWLLPFYKPNTNLTWFEIFTTITTGFRTDPKIASANLDANGVIYLGSMPADSNVVIMLEGVPTDGRIDPGDVFTLAVDATGSFVQDASNPTCQVSAPTAPTAPVEPCRLNLAGQTVLPVNATEILTPLNIGTGGKVGAEILGSVADRTMLVYGAVDQDGMNTVLKFIPAQGMSFVNDATFKTVYTGTSADMGSLNAAGYTFAATGFGTPVLNADGSITLSVANMPASSAVALHVKVTPDGSGQAMVLNSTLKAGLKGCFTEIANGDLLSGCSLLWRAGADLDQRLDNNANNGYTYKVKPWLFASNTGVLEVEHYFSGNSMIWRIPVATEYGFENGQIAISQSPSYTINKVSVLTDSMCPGLGCFARFMGIFDSTSPNYQTYMDKFSTEYQLPITWDATTGIIGFGSMPAKSHGLIQIEATANVGVDIKSTAFNMTADLTGFYVPGSGNPACALGSLSGTVFQDVNEDALLDNADVRIPEYTVTVSDCTNTAQSSAPALSAVRQVKTDSNGFFKLTDLVPCTYTVSISVVDPYTKATTVISYEAVVEASKETANLNFGLFFPAPTPVTPSVTPVTPSVTPVTPSVTPVSPTATAVTPTATAVTPTATPVTPTATPVTPTATQKAVVTIPYTGDSNNLSAFLGIFLVCVGAGMMLLASSIKRQPSK